MTSKLMRYVACISIALVLNLSAYDICCAAEETGAGADSTRTGPAAPAGPAVQPPSPSASAKDTPLVVPEESQAKPPILEAEDAGTADEGAGAAEHVPFYKNKWVWAAGAGIVLASVIAITAGSVEKQKRQLPDFPPPPTR